MREDANEKKTLSRKWKKILFTITGILIIVFSAYIVLNKIIENEVKEKLEQLAPFAKVRFSSIHANAFVSSFSVNNLSIKLQANATDSSHQHTCNFSKVEFSGIDFFSLLFNKKLSIKNLKLKTGKIKLDTFLFTKNDSLKYGLLSKMTFKNISIVYFEMEEASVWLYSDRKDKLLLTGMINMDGIEINNTDKQSSENNFNFNAIECDMRDIDYAIPELKQALQIKQLIIDSKQKNLKIDSLKITPNLTANHIKIFVPLIEVSKFDVMKLLDKKFIAGSLAINKGEIDISNPKLVDKNLKDEMTSAFTLEQIAAEIKIDSLSINHSSFKCEPLSTNNLQTAKKFFDSMNLKNFSINHFIITETNVRLQSKNEAQFKIEKIEVADLKNFVDSSFNYSSVKCKLSKIHYTIADAYRTLYINSVLIDSKKELLKIDSLKLSTQYSKFELGEKLGRQADYIEATISAIEVLKMNYRQLLNKKFIADKVVINNSKIYFFRDRRLPRELKEQPMPNDYLKQIPAEVRINVFKINNASVVSEEFSKDGDQPGFIAIEKINISMSPMFNHARKNDPHYSDTYVEGSIMNAGLIQATIHASSKANIYFIKGFIKNLDLPKLNPSAENLGKFHIESGVLNHLDFDFTATEEKASGKIIGEYHNLVIDRLKQKDGEQKIAKVPTFFLKHLIIPKNKDKSLNVAKRTGKIDYKRDSTRLVTFYFLKALLDGIRASFDLGFLLPK